MKTCKLIASGLAVCFANLPVQSTWAPVDTLYPNLCPRSCNLEFHAIQRVHVDTVLFWYQNGPANIGKGEFRLNSGDTTDADHAPAIQRIKLSSGGYIYDTIGTLVFDHDPSHDHWHFEDFVQYRLLEIVDDSLTGDTVLVNPKSGFCLTDNGGDHGSNECMCGALEGTPPANPVYGTSACLLEPDALFMGISVGFYDLYGFGVEGQSMNIVSLSNGAYWLEVTENAAGNVRETSTANNKRKIKVNIIPDEDLYEPNNLQATVDSKTRGATNSAYLSACAFPIFIDNLNIDQETNWADFYPDADWFRFRITSSADSTHFIRINFDQELGDLKLELLNSSGNSQGVGDADVGDSERVSLSGKSAGWYYARVFGDVKAVHAGNQTQYHVNWLYSLTINAPEEICGDVNGDGIVSASDILHFNSKCPTNSFLCVNLADVDGDCPIDCSADLAYLIAYVFSSPSAPAPDCTCT